jgi:NodT family efflux transporter outer membrane factor (OMF) lipoprotein
MKYRILMMSLLLLACSCNPFKPAVRTAPEGELPKSYALYEAGPEHPDRWWKSFNDPELDQLIQKALSGSFTLREAWARLDQAKAQAVKSGSALYPDLNLDAGALRGRRHNEGDTGSSTNTVESYAIGLVSSYELDLWGRVRAEKEASDLTAVATREDVNTAAMTLAAEVAERWVNIISQRMQKRLLEKQLENNRTYLELVLLRFRKSIVSALDVYQQQQVVERVKAEIPLVEAREQLLLHELALLLGSPPRTPLKITRISLPAVDQIPDTGIPADLIAKRPDVRGAGLKLRSADWQVAAARANRLPAIRLTAEASYGSDDIDLIFDNWLLSLAGNLVAPLFDGGMRAAEVDRSRALVDERLWAYRRAVLTALKEVEDALIREEKQRQHIMAIGLQVEAARKALDEAGERYLKGLNDYLPVLTQLLSVQNLERDVIERRAELLVARVSLYRALGGSWMDELEPSLGYAQPSKE